MVAALMPASSAAYDEQASDALYQDHPAPTGSSVDLGDEKVSLPFEEVSVISGNYRYHSDVNPMQNPWSATFTLRVIHPGDLYSSDAVVCFL